MLGFSALGELALAESPNATANGDTVTATATLIAGTATGGAVASGATLTATGSIPTSGTATGAATASGATVTATGSIVAGTAAGAATASGATVSATGSVPTSGTATGGASAGAATLTATGSIVAGTATGAATASGATVTATGSIATSGTATGGASASGDTVTATASLIAGTASGSTAGDGAASGDTVTATCSLVDGVATGGAAASGTTVTATATLIEGVATGTSGGGLVLPLTLDFVTATWTDGASATGPLSDLVAVAAVDPDYGNTARLAVGNLAALLLGGTPLTWVVDISDVPSGSFAVDAPFIFKTDFSAYVDFYADILGANPGYRLSDQSGGNILGPTLSAGPHRFAFNLDAAAAVSSDGGANGVATFAALTTYDKAVVVGGAVGVVSKIRILELQDAAALPALSALEVAGLFGGGGGTPSERRRVEEARRARARARAEQRVKAPKYRTLSHEEIYGKRDAEPAVRERRVHVPGGEVRSAQEAAPRIQPGALGALGAEQAREAAAAVALLAEVERLKAEALAAAIQAQRDAAFRDDEDAIAAILQAMVL